MAAAAKKGGKKTSKLDPEALAKQEERQKKVTLLLERSRLTQSVQAEEVREGKLGAVWGARARVWRGARGGGVWVCRPSIERCKWRGTN
jgi:hypothetical protein